MKKKLILIIIDIIFGIVGLIIMNNESVPIGWIISMMSWILFFLLLIWCSKNNDENNKKKKCKKKVSMLDIIFTIIIALFLFGYPILKIYESVYDLIVGPKEMILYNAEVYKTRGTHRTAPIRYLKGEVENHEYEFLIRGVELREKIIKLLEDNNQLKIIYYEKLDEVIVVEIYEK